jgi:mannan endo-1,4-beta-mannosidase
MLRFIGPRIFAALTAALLVAHTFYLAPQLNRVNVSSTTAHAAPRAGSAQPGKPTESRPHDLFPPDDKAFIGVSTGEGSHNFTLVDEFASAARHKPSVMLLHQDWALDTFNRDVFEQVAGRGMLPMLNWEPWDHRFPLAPDGSGNGQPTYTLARIISGEFDSYIRSYAVGIKDLKYEVAIRFAHGMNSPRYAWSERSNGNHPGEYARMWRHVHDIFTAAGATNVIWVWSANATPTGPSQLASLYPGNDYVDWIGLSGYYGAGDNQAYQPFGQIFDATIAEMRTFTRKPLVITEVGASDRAGRKAAWISDMFAQLRGHPDIIGFTWSETMGESDWRIVTPPAAADAFAAGAADPRYVAPWSTDLLGRDGVEISTVLPALPVAPSMPVKKAAPDPALPRTTAPPPTPAPTKTTSAPSPPAPPPPPTTDPLPSPQPTTSPEPSTTP